MRPLGSSSVLALLAGGRGNASMIVEKVKEVKVWSGRRSMQCGKVDQMRDFGAVVGEAGSMLRTVAFISLVKLPRGNLGLLNRVLFISCAHAGGLSYSRSLRPHSICEISPRDPSKGGT